MTVVWLEGVFWPLVGVIALLLLAIKLWPARAFGGETNASMQRTKEKHDFIGRIDGQTKEETYQKTITREDTA